MGADDNNDPKHLSAREERGTFRKPSLYTNGNSTNAIRWSYDRLFVIQKINENAERINELENLEPHITRLTEKQSNLFERVTELNAKVTAIHEDTIRLKVKCEQQNAEQADIAGAVPSKKNMVGWVALVYVLLEFLRFIGEALLEAVKKL